MKQPGTEVAPALFVVPHARNVQCYSFTVRISLLLVIAACGSHAEAPRASAPPYLAMFGAGRSWTLHSGSDAAECRVATVSRLGDASLAHVVCAKPHDDLAIVGWWVAAPAGLYHPYTQPETEDELTALSEDDLLLNARPAERHHEVSLGPTHETLDAVPFGHGWCISTETSAAGARRAWTLCLDDSGMVGVADIVDMGSGATTVQLGSLPPPEPPAP